MINNIELQNFELHKYKYIEFKKGINVISGTSGIGKSSIIKSINWVINGEPNGNGMIKHYTKECRVKIDIDNNIIEKVKSDKENKYIINDVELNSVGQSVPEEIKDLNFNDLNLQMQFSPFFLLQDSPGEIARKLNKIIDLEIIDKITKKAKTEVYDKKRKIDLLESDIIDIKNRLEKYKDLDKIEIIINKLESLENKKNTYIEQNKYLLESKKRLREYQEELEKYKYNVKISKIIEKLKDLFKDYNKKVLLLDMLVEYKNNIKEIKNIQNRIFSIKQLRNSIIKKGDLCPVCGKII